MKYLVLSDSHGNVDNMVRAVELVKPQGIIHLGDGWRDVEELRELFPSLPLEQVPGNCDFAAREPDPDIFFAGPVKVFATHGHRYSVKLGLDGLLNAAHFSGAGLVLYGHTHIARVDYYGGMTVVNPGSSGLGTKPTFALIEVTDEGRVAARIMNIMP
mgnify:CR=1 FL=1